MNTRLLTETLNVFFLKVKTLPVFVLRCSGTSVPEFMPREVLAVVEGLDGALQAKD